jgi:hypothetical protein
MRSGTCRKWRERYLELAPKNWVATRAKLLAEELSRPAGAITVPA